jgi:gamma-glutamylcyclotransferase (GGCT)/AIG2-like uncharacterized protein YtfP
MKSMFYFAYGVNLNQKKMEEYCPGAIYLGTATLAYHRLRFDGQSIRRPGATANIEENIHHDVQGALFAIDDKDLKQLDEFENYPISYQRKLVTIFARNQFFYDVVTYFREGKPEGKPGSSYLAEVLEGGYAKGLPADYLQKLCSTPYIQ